MKRGILILSILLLCVLSAIGGWGWFQWTHQSLKGVGDKWEIHIRKRPDNDSLTRRIQQIDQELEEMRYYMNIHNVTDEGFDLVAHHNTQLLIERRRANALMATADTPRIVGRKLVKSYQRPMIAIKTRHGYWRAGHYSPLPLTGKGVMRDEQGRVLWGLWDHDTIVVATRTDSTGVYFGQMDSHYQACGQGSYDRTDGSRYAGHWKYDREQGWGYNSSPYHHVQAGEWNDGRFLGEKLTYTSERIYGIDVSRHQHEKGRKRFPLYWNKLRITSLGARHNKRVSGTADYPVSFAYIKATEGTTIYNRYYKADYQQARRYGIRVGTYHFFSLKSSALAQAKYFLKYASIRQGDFPPVLDIEPSDQQIAAIGGAEELFRRVRIWVHHVEQASGRRPILYINQMFVNRYLPVALDIKQKYHVWIARYGEYKPDVKLDFWQLSPEGRVTGITGPVDINVFNGYSGQYEEYIREFTHR